MTQYTVSAIVEYAEDGKVRLSTTRTFIIADGEKAAVRIYGKCSETMEALKPWTEAEIIDIDTCPICKGAGCTDPTEVQR